MTAGPADVFLGLRAKTGRAIAVVLRGPAEAPEVLRHLELAYCKSEIQGPYHAVLDLPWAQAAEAVKPAVARIGEAAAAALEELVLGLRAEQLEVRGAGIVGAGPRHLARIGNTHIRAHAAEGVVFREVLEAAAARSGIPSFLFGDRELYEKAAAELGLAPAALLERVTELGHAAGRPWRADEKAAAAAAWAVLAMDAPS